MQNNYNLFYSVLYGVCSGLGYMLAIILLAGIRERMDETDMVPESLKGLPISLITAGLMSIAFMGFQGLIR